MNRRAFFGAFGALLALPAVALASRSVPRFRVDEADCRIHFTPFGEFDWIEMPSVIIDLMPVGANSLLINCVGGDYMLTGFHDPRAMVLKQVR